MKTVTYEQFLKFEPCWLEDEDKAAQLKEYGERRREWTALDVLRLPEVSAKDRLWAVLREEFIDADILHEFACQCAEYALSFVSNPDPRSVAAIEAKRKWLRGEISDKDLSAAADAAWTVLVAALAAADAAADAALAAARVALAAARVAWDAADTVDTASEKEIDMLIELLEEKHHEAGL